MAIIQGARAKSLAWTGTGPTSPLNSIQDFTFSQPEELVAFLNGNARVEGHYKGKKAAKISVTTANLALWSGFAVGQVFTNLILTLEGAVDSAGTAVGSDITITLSKVVVSAIGDLTKGNDGSDPVTASVEFTLTRAAADTSDPTVAIAAAA